MVITRARKHARTVHLDSYLLERCDRIQVDRVQQDLGGASECLVIESDGSRVVIESGGSLMFVWHDTKYWTDTLLARETRS